MRYAPRALLAGGIGFAVSLLAACGGGGGLLSGNQAGNLQNNLNQISAAVSTHNCLGADSRSRALAAAVLRLPSTVSSTLRNDLAQGASTVSQLAQRQCGQNTTPTNTNTTTATTTTTTTTPTSTTQTSTTSTSTTPTSPTTPTSTTPATTPSGGAGPGGGGSGGAGPGGGGGGGGGSGGGGHVRHVGAKAASGGPHGGQNG